MPTLARLLALAATAAAILSACAPTPAPPSASNRVAAAWANALAAARYSFDTSIEPTRPGGRGGRRARGVGR